MRADDETASGPVVAKPMRADAQRSLDALLQAAKEVFVTDGVDAPIRDIASRAGLGVGTIYRHFPQRSELIAAVFRREIDDCADAACEFAATLDPFGALRKWLQRFSMFFATKRGLAMALHSGEAAYAALPGHFEDRLRPSLQRLLTAAIDAKQIRSDVTAGELLGAVAQLSTSVATDTEQAQRIVGLLADGLRLSIPPHAR